MKTLYVSDLDGTLLNSDTKLSDKTKKIINQLVKNGTNFTFATARSITSASVVTSGLQLHTPLIVYNGVHILDPITHEVLYSYSFHKDEIRKIMDEMIHHNIIPFVYAYIDGKERVSYMEQELHEGAIYYMESRPYDKRFRKVNTIEELLEGDIFYLNFIHDKNVLDPIYKYLTDYTDYTVIFQQELYRDEYWLEVMPSGVSKANAIMKLKELGGYDRIVSFGDAKNDIAMFEISDECYAVYNAIDELKQVASDVIGDHDEDAVASWLLKEFERKGMQNV